MAGEEPEVPKKHHISSDDRVDEGSKRRKHSHHRSSHRRHHHHHHRHRSSKHDRENKLEDQDMENSSPPHEILPLVPNSKSNSLPDDDKEEGEILDEEEYGVANGILSKKKDDSDVESGEIKSAEAFSELELKNLRINDGGDDFSGGNKETERKDLMPLENDKIFKSPVNRRGNIEYKLSKSPTGKDNMEIADEVDVLEHSRTEHLVSKDKDHEIGEIDTESVEQRKTKEERRHRSKMSRRSNGHGHHRSREGDQRTESGLKSPLEGTDMETRHRDSETSSWTRNGRSMSRSPVYEEAVNLKKHRRVDDIDANELDSLRHAPRKHLELEGVKTNGYGNRRKSPSPYSLEDKYASGIQSPHDDRNHEEGHVRKRSRSRDHRRSRSRSYVQDGKEYHRELDVKSYSERNIRVRPSSSRENARNASDQQRVIRHDREDKHDSRDWARDMERERSSSYSRHSRREDWHGSRGTHERERERERERVKERDRDRDVDKDRHRDRNRDIDKDRHRDRNRERGRMDLDLDVYRDSRHSQHNEVGDYWDRRSKYQSKLSSNKKGDLEEAEEKLKRDDEEQGDYEEKAVQEEEDVDKIKEESRKRREAILEKHRRRQQEKQSTCHSEDSEREKEGSHTFDKQTDQISPAKLSANSATEGLASRNNGSEESNADLIFNVGKSPSQNGAVSSERASRAGGLGDGTPKSERSEEKFCGRKGDMFCDDIFGESPAGVRKMDKEEGMQVERNGLNDNWDDSEGYYSYRFGEVLDGRYEIIAAHGKGVFSSVVRAKDLKAGRSEPEEVAIKIIRNNETMFKAGQDELVILKKLVGADPEDRRHCVRFISSFKYRNHLCLVFESLHMNLREVLKKFGRNIGLKLTAVRAYAKQLFIALKHLRNCGVLHSDIKPDNMLVNEAKNVLKLCDFGNAMFAGKNDLTPYLVSRFYRAPEIILGLPYDHPMDIWSVGCCLYELYSGKVLFPGPSNNDMLRLHMELKGPFPKKMLRKGAFTDHHFDHDLTFCATEEDPVTKKTVKRLLHTIKSRDIGAIITGSPGEDPKMLTNFKDLLERIFVLDPEKRMTVSQALNHPFITGK